ncbi:DUF3365 domain-containing protein [Litoribrevibacter euphylliae]|uniref:DUF3365 domain-containing protein n=1 Tax=Litoribrevibacter euphylliae TaxID=1834034 RepID=A0ABV7HK58_9GAMM
MKRTSTLISTGLFSLICLGMSSSVWPQEQDEKVVEQLTMEARSKVKAFASQLKSTLKQELKTNGSISAVKVCNLDAPAIADSVSTDGWQVSRTAFKVRNPSNKPDTWEKTVLADFDALLAQGAAPQAIEYAAVVDDQFRYMKAIPTGSVCLACHGSEINPELKQQIHTLYPEDQATGFSVGDLRGAFSLTRELN